MAWLTRLFFGILAILLFFLAALAVNQAPIALHFLAWQTPELSVFWWLLIAFVGGLLLGLLGITVLLSRQSLRNRRLSKQLAQSERELADLRKVTLRP